MSKQIIRAEYESDKLLQQAVDYLCDNGIDHNSIKVSAPGANLSEQIFDDDNTILLGSASSLTGGADPYSSDQSGLYPIVNTVETIGQSSMQPEFIDTSSGSGTTPTIYITVKKDSADEVRDLLDDTGASGITTLS